MSKQYEIPEESIDDISLLEPEAIYSYADYLRWQFEDRVELIKGKLFKMSAPNRMHQVASRNILLEMGAYLKGQKCQVYCAPFDVRLPKKLDEIDEMIYNVVQPDVCVICDESKLDDAGCVGAPDLVVEILSPSTATKDLKNKFELYQENGVLEYWLVYSGEQIVEIYSLNENHYYGTSRKYCSDEIINSSVLTGFQLKVMEIFVA